MSVARWYVRWNRQVVRLYLASRRAHETRWQVIDVAAGGAIVVFLWLVIGRIAGIAFAILWGLLMLLHLSALWARRSTRPDPLNTRSDPPAES